MSFNLRPVFDRESAEQHRKKLEEIFDRPDFKEFERKMRADAKSHLADFEALESRMLVTTASERAEFYKYGRSPVQAWLDDAGFPWPKPNVLQIDKDYEKYCADLGNRPTFLSWCISRAYQSTVINKTANLGATKCVLSQL